MGAEPQGPPRPGPFQSRQSRGAGNRLSHPGRVRRPRHPRDRGARCPPQCADRQADSRGATQAAPDAATRGRAGRPPIPRGHRARHRRGHRVPGAKAGEGAGRPDFLRLDPRQGPRPESAVPRQAAQDRGARAADERRPALGPRHGAAGRRGLPLRAGGQAGPDAGHGHQPVPGGERADQAGEGPGGQHPLPAGGQTGTVRDHAHAAVPRPVGGAGRRRAVG